MSSRMTRWSGVTKELPVFMTAWTWNIGKKMGLTSKLPILQVNWHPPSLIRVFAVCTKKAWVLSYPLSAQQRLWSDCADLSLRCAHTHFVGFVMSQLISFVCLCWGLTSQSTIFQSCRDGATASWVINQYFRGVKCLAQGHNTAAVGFEPPTSCSGVRHSTTEPPQSLSTVMILSFWTDRSVQCRPWSD